jgi:D-alanyl-D-alanine carboxypeptidase (penicillin-binding protein 5/6)
MARKRSWTWLWVTAVILGTVAALCGGYYWFATTRSWVMSQSIDFPLNNQTWQGKDLTLDLPEQGRTVIGFVDPEDAQKTPDAAPQCRVFGDDSPQPTASMAKLITTLVTLDAHPLDLGEDGPTITLDASAVAEYQKQVALGGSRVQVRAGEQLTLHQILQAVLIVSANNLADYLAIWGFGSQDAYRNAATAWLSEHGLTNTTIGKDASGLDPGTTASPSDLCRLMLLAAQNPVLTEIMGTTETPFPVEGTLKSTNHLLGSHGVFAGKTGGTDEAGRNIVITTKLPTHTNPDGVVVAIGILQQTDYDVLFSEANGLLDSLPANLYDRPLVSTGDVVGQYHAKWGDTVDLAVTDTVTDFSWADTSLGGMGFETSEGRNRVIPSGTQIGQFTSDLGDAGVVTTQQIGPPPIAWQLKMAFG